MAFFVPNDLKKNHDGSMACLLFGYNCQLFKAVDSES